MTDIAEMIRETRSGHVRDGLYLTVFPHNVINIDGRTRKLDAADIKAVTDAITEAGFEQVEAWSPWVGLSYMSDGVQAGVSFRLRKVAADA